MIALLSITVKNNSFKWFPSKGAPLLLYACKHKLTWILRIKWTSINMRLGRELGSHRGSSSISTRRCRRSGRVVSRNLPGHCAILGTRSGARGCWKASVKGNQESITNTQSDRTEGRGSYFFVTPRHKKEDENQIISTSKVYKQEDS